MAYRRWCYGSSEALQNASLYKVICAGCSTVSVTLKRTQCQTKQLEEADTYPDFLACFHGDDLYKKEVHRNWPLLSQIRFLICINQGMTGLLLLKKHMYTSHLYVILMIHMLILEQKHTGVNVQAHTHGYVNIHTNTHQLTLPRFICQDDSWTLAEVEFAKQNPSLG